MQAISRDQGGVVDAVDGFLAALHGIGGPEHASHDGHAELACQVAHVGGKRAVEVLRLCVQSALLKGLTGTLWQHDQARTLGGGVAHQRSKVGKVVHYVTACDRLHQRDLHVDNFRWISGQLSTDFSSPLVVVCWCAEDSAHDS